MKDLPVPKTLIKELEKASLYSRANAIQTGDTYARSFENWQLLKRYKPFIADIADLRNKYKKPKLYITTDQIYGKRGFGIHSSWAEANFPNMGQEIGKLASKYNSQSLWHQIAYFFLYSKDYNFGGSPNNFYIENTDRSKKAVWTKVIVNGMINDKEAVLMQNMISSNLYGAIVEPTTKEPKEKRKVCYTYDQANGKLIFDLFFTQDDYNKHEYSYYSKLIAEISKHYFKKYKLSKSLFKNLLLMDAYEREYTLLRFRLGDYEYDPEDTNGPGDVIMSIYQDLGDELDNKDIKRLRANIRKIQQRVSNIQKERFVTHPEK